MVFMFIHKNRGSTVYWHQRLNKDLLTFMAVPLLQKLFSVEKGSLGFLNVLHTKNGSFKNCSLKGSLRNRGLWHCCEKPPTVSFILKSVCVLIHI